MEGPAGEKGGHLFSKEKLISYRLCSNIRRMEEIKVFLGMISRITIYICRYPLKTWVDRWCYFPLKLFRSLSFSCYSFQKSSVLPTQFNAQLLSWSTSYSRTCKVKSSNSDGGMMVIEVGTHSTSVSGTGATQLCACVNMWSYSWWVCTELLLKALSQQDIPFWKGYTRTSVQLRLLRHHLSASVLTSVMTFLYSGPG